MGMNDVCALLLVVGILGVAYYIGVVEKDKRCRLQNTEGLQSKMNVRPTPVPPPSASARQRTRRLRVRPRPKATATAKKKELKTWGDGTPRVLGSDVKPFYRGNLPPGHKAVSNVRRMGQMTGVTGMHRKKTETAPLFKPTRGLTDVFGKPANEGFEERMAQMRNAIQHTYVRGGENKSVSVARGLGRTAKDDPTMTRGYGGYHQLERAHLMPRSVDQLRTHSNQKETYRGRVAGPSGAIGVGTARPTGVRSKTALHFDARMATGGGATLRPYQPGDTLASIRATRQARETDRYGMSAPSAGRLGQTYTGTEMAQVRRTGLDVSRLGAAPAAQGVGFRNREAAMAPVHKTEPNSAWFNAPSAGNLGAIDANAQIAPLRKSVLPAFANGEANVAPRQPSQPQNRDAEIAPIRPRQAQIPEFANGEANVAPRQPSQPQNRDAEVAPLRPRQAPNQAFANGNANVAPGQPSRPQNRDAEVAPLRPRQVPNPAFANGNTNVAPRQPSRPLDRGSTPGVEASDRRENPGNMTAAVNTTQGIRSYNDVYNATLSETRGLEENGVAIGAMANVQAAGSRDAVAGAFLSDRADLMAGRTPGAKYDGPRAQDDQGGDLTRQRRGPEGRAAMLQPAASAVPAASTVAGIGVSGSDVAGVPPSQPFVENDERDLSIARDQLAVNPYAVQTVG